MRLPEKWLVHCTSYKDSRTVINYVNERVTFGYAFVPWMFLGMHRELDAYIGASSSDPDVVSVNHMGGVHMRYKLHKSEFTILSIDEFMQCIADTSKSGFALFMDKIDNSRIK